MTESQSAVKAAIDLAKRNNRPILAKKRIKDRDEGYDVNDDFVDDSELLINEPKFQPKPKIEGYCAIVGEVEVIDNDKDLKSVDALQLAFLLEYIIDGMYSIYQIQKGPQIWLGQ